MVLPATFRRDLSPFWGLFVAGAAISGGTAAGTEDAGLISKGLAGAGDEPGETLFTALSEAESGIDFVNPIDTEHPLERIYLGAFACGGVAIGDLDGDGVADLFLTSGPLANRFYRGGGGLRFEDATEAAGFGGKEPDAWAAGATLVDIDADGDLDVHVCYYDSANELWINDGAGRFEERAEAFGLAISDASLMASFCDYDLDGDLDCFLLTRDFKRAGGRPEEHPIEQVDGKYRITPPFDKYYDLVPQGDGKLAYVNAGREDRLLRNDGGKFVDVSAAVGISGRDRGNSATWWDYDGDGWPDLYVGNDFKDPDRLYRNNGDGTFTDVIKEVATHTPWFSMGADAGDLDGDGRLDFLIADMAGTNHYRSKTTMGEMGAARAFLLSAVPRQYMHNVLYLNNGVGRLSDAAFLAGLASSDWCWAVQLDDFDLDGRTDVFFTNGVSRSFNSSDVQRAPEDYIGMEEWDFYEPLPPRREENLAFANRGGLKFENTSEAWGLGHLGMSYAAATGDLDGDGDPEVVVASLDEPVRVYRNDSPASARRLVVRLLGQGGNRGGLGAKVVVEAGGQLQTQVLQPAVGFLSCNAPELVFGLGDEEEAEALTVTWPRGHVQRFEGLATGRRYTVSEPEGRPPGPEGAGRKRPMFANVTSPTLAEVVHRERAFDDYARQPLLPYQHSQLGPGMAWSDVDGDGDQDFYLSAAAGQAGRVLVNDGRASFSEAGGGVFEPSAGSEDMGVLFFDADGDRDPDLYVVSGGVECDAGSELLADRLYLNDGSGGFSPAGEGALPAVRDSGSCVVAADYDRDGDLDLFVGGRVVPGAYPVTPSSRLLRNESRPGAVKFVDVTASVDGLERAGLVTAGLWSDADGDGWNDLLVCCEWGPVRVFLNREGRLEEATDAAGLGSHLGWWNGIAGADFDGDGDIDYVVTNMGLNSPYKATKKAPEVIYYGDFDGSGAKRIVEAKFEGGTLFPRRGFSCSSGAMPVLRDRLKTFHNFASSTLAELYSGPRLDGSLRLEANTLASCVLSNDGSGRFRVTPLPPAAQLSPGYGVALADFDADGHIDVLMAQNFFGAQPEVGLFDAGLSVLLRGNGDGSFTAVEPGRSGFVVPADCTSVTLADLNGNGRPEIFLGVNGRAPLMFSEPREPLDGRRLLEVRLRGKAGNPTAAGALVSVVLKGAERAQTAEMTLGSGYLGHSAPALWFGLGEASFATPVSIEVRWPDGEETRHEAAAGDRTVEIGR